ncbi:MAG: Rrf2 family transcriptional regulator [Planctomycetia bacterium]|uniref:Transcriptional regulator n=1 Tax=Candidatus Brocadia sapporoensis TaxID=392547 RepID=A0A1V6LXZ5_9BACT|nr:Rrf2 family transcriptional regulator [Candidatus Brocadia sapporoensis]MCC7237998.1 Rrf2 family transcriptional regulator [Candidatus Brocadia sp.]QOJ07023.1 MAG: Rrf2 family transcriptional regulator [Planctomycetia bacterium]TVL96213.1 MAG: Rrf2 family transcriptional regulator [Candidatus Brocadia sp. BL1]MDG6005330.1 Rrf2 family transcriptional regulator [Candidatus Brocadia sp.]OQD45024.1 transcriptional regulator [Candidatus Brocadia sapporoensis]
MKLSKKSDYALRAIIYLSMHYNKGAIQIREISANEKIPQKFLENILLVLRKAGILNSKIGLKGGYELARSPDLITLGEVIRALDGAIAPVDCVSKISYKPCSEEVTCVIRGVMLDIRNAITDVLDRMTFADMCSRVRDSMEKKESNVLTYAI